MTKTNLSRETIAYINNFVDTSLALGMDVGILSSEVARARDKELKKFIVETNNPLPKNEFDYLVISRINILKSRLALAPKEHTIEAEYSEDRENLLAVRNLTIESENMAVQYRTMTAENLRVPRQVMDTFDSGFALSTEDIEMASKAIRAMPQHKDRELVTLISHKGEVTLEIADINNDRYTHKLGMFNCGSFAHQYDAKVVLSILRQNARDGVEISIGENKGYFRTTVNGFTTFVAPIQEE